MSYNSVKARLQLLANRFIPESFNIADSGSFVATSFLINGITFAYNVYLGRRLPLADFGLIAVIGNLLGLLQIPLSAYSKAITHRAAYLLGKSGKPDLQNWRYFRQTSFLASAALTVFWVIAIPFLLKFFSISQATPLLILAPLWIVSVTSSVDSGFLMGVHKFKTLARILLVESLAMLALTVVLVEIGYADLLYLAIPASAFIAFAMGWQAIIKIPNTASKNTKPASHNFPWKFFTHSLVTKVTSIAFISIDVLLAKHFLDQQSAGEYALLALVGKMIFYASLLLGQFVIPAVSKEAGVVGGNVAKVFRVLFLPTALLMLVAYIGLGVLGTFTIPLLLGENARAIVSYVPFYALGMACFGLSNMIVTYYQSRQKYGITFTSFASIIFIVIGILFFHTSVASISAVVSATGITSLLLALLYRHLQPSTNKKELPHHVAGFTLVQQIAKDYYTPAYKYGLYENSRKQKALGKYWHGQTKGFSYNRLRHEITVSTILSAVQKRIHRRVANHNVRIPAVIHVDATNTSLLVLFEWISTVKQTQRISASQLVARYELVSNYLQLLAKHLTISERKHISERPGWKIVLLYPIGLLKAVYANPQMSKQLVAGLVKFSLTTPSLLQAAAIRLSHRDLHAENLLTDTKKIYLIDHAFTAITLKYYELISLLASHWQNAAVRKILLKKLDQEVLSSVEKKQCIGLGIWVATILLGDPNLPEAVRKNYLASLNYWTNYNA